MSEEAHRNVPVPTYLLDRVSLEQQQFCYLTTTGRSTGRPHRIEIWFAIVDKQLYVISGGGTHSDWVKNLLSDPAVNVQIDDRAWRATATLRDRVGTHPARERLAERYQGWHPGDPLTQWATEGLLIQISAAAVANDA